MNIEHVAEWVRVMRTTTKPQAQEALVKIIDGDGTLGYCCLGLGAVECLGFQPIWDDGLEVGDKLTVAGVTDLAPREFVKWLGLYPTTDDIRTEFDIWINWPRGMIDREGHWFRPDDGAHRQTGLTCASLNDAGFTFAQIADIVEFFGIYLSRDRS